MQNKEWHAIILVVIFISGISTLIGTSFFYTKKNMDNKLRNEDDRITSVETKMKEFTTKEAVVRLLNKCELFGILKKEFQESANVRGINCDAVCGRQAKSCIFGYVSLEHESDPYITSQRTGLVQCNVANGPANTNNLMCMCCSYP